MEMEGNTLGLCNKGIQGCGALKCGFCDRKISESRTPLVDQRHKSCACSNSQGDGNSLAFT